MKSSDKNKSSILFLGKLPPPYIGPTIATEIILKSKIKDDFKLIHLDMSDHRELSTLARIDFMNFYYAFKQYVNLIYYLIKYKIDLVYIPFGQSTISCYRDGIFILISKIFRKKVLTHLRGSNLLVWFDSAGKMTKWVFRFIYRKIDGQIVLGENLKHLYLPFIAENKIFVVHNGGNFKIPIVNNKNERISILFLGNLFESKGVLDTLLSAAFLKDYNDKFTLRFSGYLKDFFVKKSFGEFKNENPDLNIEVLEPTSGDEKMRLFAESDIFVFPSYNEGHPWVVIEAMSAGLPVITTDTGAITESVIDNVNGYIINKGSPNEIAEKIRFLIDYPDIRIKMGEESRRLYKENFTEDIMINKLSDVFNIILSQ